MKQLFVFVWIVFLFSFFALPAKAQVHAQAGQTPLVAGNATLSTGFSGTGANIDVTYQKCDWTIDPTLTTKKISGTVTITFVTKVANVSAVSFDLNNTSFNNPSLKVTYNGSSVPFSFPTTGNLNILNITLPSALPINTQASVVITYAGTPPAVNNQAEGYQSNTTNANTTDDTKYGKFIYTLSESYEDRDWWPCKADMQDKIDKMDIWITCPNGYRAATNGAFIDSNTVVSGFRTFKYQTKHPIASYLVAVGVANYYVYDRGTVNIGGTNVPVWYWLYPNRTTTSYNNIIAFLDKSKTELANFSAKYGNYGFTDEKHGYYEFGWGGGMEHQSFSGMGASSLTSWSVIAHELAHQWFGDKVSFSTWNDLWLAEAFASYSEALAIELDPSLSATESPVTVRTTFRNDARALPTTEVYVPNANITSSNALWTSNYGNSVYQKGAMVVSMLRKLVGDAKFFQALQNYQSDPALVYKSATTDDLRRHFEAVAGGYNLAPFFDAWVKAKGHADYAVKWNNNAKRIAIQIGTQTRSLGATASFFPTPVVVRVSNGLTGTSLKDTTIVIYSQGITSVSYAGNGISTPQSTNTLSYVLSFTPSTVSFDPNVETMSTGTVTKDATINPLLYTVMPVNIIDFKGVKTASGNLLSLLLEQTHETTSVLAERSENGSTFTTIGEMMPGGAFENNTLYTLEDKNFSNTHSWYYRAKTVDENGTVRYSKTVHLKNDVKITGGLSIQPNVVADHVNLLLSEGWEKRPVTITIYNSAGVAVKTIQQRAAASLQIPVQQLPSGTYHTQLASPGGETISRPFVVSR